MTDWLTALPRELYPAAATREMDRLAIQEQGIPGYTLMTRAGQACLALIQQAYPLARKVLVLCGAGNNGGDGYVLARLAHKAGLSVQVVSLLPGNKLTGEAGQAYADWKSLGHQSLRWKPELLQSVDLVVDAMLGTGLTRDVEGQWRDCIEAVNAWQGPVLAVDLPSGLDSDTGMVRGIAMRATHTQSFIGLKQGQFTAHGRDVCGEIRFADLGVPEAVRRQVPSRVRRLDVSDIAPSLPRRLQNSHKGDYGHVLVVGGNRGMAGAALLAGQAALRAGAGRVTLLTRPEHVTGVLAAQAELMVQGNDSGKLPHGLLDTVDAVILGPGLGQDEWARSLLAGALESRQPLVVDADALRLLNPEDRRDNWVLTPHPGEAASLLQTDSGAVQSDRFDAVTRLQQQYGGSVVLKGSGSLVASAPDRTSLCPYGNPGMASAGMGDVLSGVIGALLAQGMDGRQAAETGVLIHALAGDDAVTRGGRGTLARGTLASDLLEPIRQRVNP